MDHVLLAAPSLGPFSQHQDVSHFPSVYGGPCCARYREQCGPARLAPLLPLRACCRPHVGHSNGWGKETPTPSGSISQDVWDLIRVPSPGASQLFWGRSFFREVNFFLFNPRFLKQVTHSMLLQAGYYDHKSFCFCSFHLH